MQYVLQYRFGARQWRDFYVTSDKQLAEAKIRRTRAKQKPKLKLRIFARVLI